MGFTSVTRMDEHHMFESDIWKAVSQLNRRRLQQVVWLLKIGDLKTMT